MQVFEFRHGSFTVSTTGTEDPVLLHVNETGSALLVRFASAAQTSETFASGKIASRSAPVSV